MKVITKDIYCVDSLDYTQPIGAKNDNRTSMKYVIAIEEYFNNRTPLTTIEFGCAGCLIVKTLADRGHNSYGIEGTPHPLQRPQWKEFHNERLFTCDLSKPFRLIDDDGNDMKFDVISHWEFLEHLPVASQEYFHAKLYTHLKEDGIILAGISPWGPSTSRDRFEQGDPRKTAGNQVHHHQSCFHRDEWEELYWNKLFVCNDYPLNAKLRHDGKPGGLVQSIYVALTRLNTPESDQRARNIIAQKERNHFDDE